MLAAAARTITATTALRDVAASLKT
jgi:hypothetical protein